MDNVTTDLQQALHIPIHPALAELTQAERPGVVGTHYGIEVKEDEQWLSDRECLDGGSEVIIEVVLNFNCGSQY